MSSVQITTPQGSASGSVELPAEIFDCQVNVPLMHQVVTAQLAAARQGSQKLNHTVKFLVAVKNLTNKRNRKRTSRFYSFPTMDWRWTRSLHRSSRILRKNT